MQHDARLFCPKTVVGFIEILYLGTSFHYKTNIHEKTITYRNGHITLYG
jgi:hypothetical protein